MNKLKKFFIILASVLLTLYLLFLILISVFGNLNGYIPQIQKTVKDMVGLDLNVKSAKISPTVLMEVKLNVDGVRLSYPDKNNILKLDNVVVKVPVLPIILGNIKLSEIKIVSPEIDFKLGKNGEIDVVNYLEPYLEKMQNPDNSDKEIQNNGLPKYFRISTKMPDTKISNYNINIFDETINKTVSINGENIDLVKFDIAKGLKVITKGEIKTENQKFAKYDIAVETFLPKIATTTTTPPKTQMVFIDPFQSMIKYGFFTDIFADLKITESKEDVVNIQGNLDVKELNLKTNKTDTKGTYAKLKFDKNNIGVDASLYLTKNQKAQVNANLKYGKKNNIKIDVKSDKLDLIHFVDIAQALLSTLGIESELKLLSVSGYVSPNFSITSDMKKLESSGHIYLKEGKISHKTFLANITDINSDIDLNGNKISIVNTKALVNGQPVTISGNVTQDAKCDLLINSNNLSLPSLFEIFADKNLKNSYKITSGNLGFDVKIKGKLDKLMPSADVKLTNLNLIDKINHFTVNLPNANAKVTSDLKTFKGDVTLGTTKITLSDFNLSALVKGLKLAFDEKDLVVNPFEIDVKNSVFKTQASVKNYMTNMLYEISTQGNLSTETIMSFVPKELKSMISNKGVLPLNAKVFGDLSSLNLNANVSANSLNYITPIHITQLLNKPSELKVDIKTKGNDLIINNISINSQGVDFADIKGQIVSYLSKNPSFKNLKVNIPNAFSFSIPNMKNSSVTLKSDLAVSGTMNTPIVLGNINVSNLDIPTFKVKAKNVDVNMTNSTIKANSDDVKIADSDIRFNVNAVNNFGKIFTINNLTVNSNNLDLGQIMTLMSQMPQNSNAPGTDFPLLIKTGKGNIKTFKMDAIVAKNASADFSLKDNTLYLNNLKANAYNGDIMGNLSYNLQYLRMKTKLKGQNLNANSAVTAFVGLKDQMNGNLNFNADITMSGSEFKQQMQTLKGTASFVILDGQMGSLGKFEHFLYAQNLLSQKFVKTTIGSIASGLAPKNTGKFTQMSGDIALSNGWAQIVQVTSTGPNMSLYLTGRFNLLNNYADIDILGQISKEVANSLGIVSDLSLEKLTSNFSKFGSTLSSVVSGYNLSASKEYLDKIPKLSTGVVEGTKSFKVEIDGVIDSVSAVKSFMWLMNSAEAEAKKKELIQNSSILNNMPNLKEKLLNNSSTTTTSNQSQTTSVQADNENTTVPLSKEEVKTQIKNQLKNSLPSFLDNIGTQE